MQNFSDATYKNILDYMLSLVPDTYDKRDTSPIQTSLGPAAYVLEGFYLSLDLVQKQAFVQTAAGDSLDLLAVLAGITRKQASAAVKVGIFDCEVPIGARFSTINGTESINFVVISTITGDVVKNGVCTMVGVIGSLIASQFGGWDAALSTLILFMAVDYITGLVVAGVFHASPKSKDGTLESRAGWKGLCRKGETLLIVLVACRLDAVMGSTFVRDAVVIGFICNETISIIENAGLMGLPIPEAITKAVDILKQRSETEQKG